MTAPESTVLWSVAGDSGRCWTTQAECLIQYLERNRQWPLPSTLKLRAHQGVISDVMRDPPESFADELIAQTLLSIRSHDNMDIQATPDMLQSACHFIDAIKAEALPWVAPPIEDKDPVEVDVSDFVKIYYSDWVKQGVTFANPTRLAQLAQESQASQE